MSELLISVLSVAVSAIIIPIITWCGAELTKYLNSKNKLMKCNEQLSFLKKLVEDCVKSVSQTYVNHLKENNAFTKEEQIKAFNKAKEEILLQLSEQSRKFIQQNYGDLNKWISIQIESTIDTLKK